MKRSPKSFPTKCSVRRTTPFADLPDWLSSREVQAYLRLGRDAFRARLKSGELPHRRFGRLIRVPKESLRPTSGKTR